MIRIIRDLYKGPCLFPIKYGTMHDNYPHCVFFLKIGSSYNVKMIKLLEYFFKSKIDFIYKFKLCK